MTSSETSYFYIHIPFCKQKCTYCKFALTPVFDDTKKKRYLSYLKNEIREYFKFYSTIQLFNHPTSIYFGGGTPSILTLSEIREILHCFPGIENVTEITIECNPEDITAAYIEGLIDLGVNRVSLGVQTLNETSLTEIQRSNTSYIFSALREIDSVIRRDLSPSQMNDRVIQTTQKQKLSVNVDFILGLPYVGKGETLEGIKFLHKEYSYITHTSVYMLEDEKYPKHWRSHSITEKEMQSEFLEIMEYFETIDWNHYELSNFAKLGYESIHNQAYWNHSNYRGFGLSAASYEDGSRWTHARSFSGYYAGKREDEEVLTEEQIEIEKMMFGLRTTGTELGDAQNNSHKDREIGKLISDGLLEIQDNKIKPTKTGIFLLDHIMGRLV